MKNLTCSNTIQVILTVLEFWYRMHRFQSQISMTNDNFHQLCFSTTEEIVKISMMTNTVEDPNHDPNLYSER